MGKKAGKIALGLGLLTGAVTGLLFAPDEGKNIRKKIASGDTKGLLSDLDSMFDEMGDAISALVNRPEVTSALDKGKTALADVVDMERAELDKLLTEVNAKAEKMKKMAAKYVKEQKALLEKKAPKKKKSTKRKSTAKKKSTSKKTTASKKATPKKSTSSKKKK